MLVSANIEDRLLQEQIAKYLAGKQNEISDLMVEALKQFFKKDNSVLNYKVQDADKHAKVIDFNLEDTDADYKLFKDVDDVQSYSRELRANAWK
ncbi:hypothetical protein KKC13_03120 [bacterium]|nr:hypothetical protein [bacterium]MBU1958037.1 hypothetical protein [bacterium]